MLSKNQQDDLNNKLFHAVDSGNIESVKYQIKKGAEVDYVFGYAIKYPVLLRATMIEDKNKAVQIMTFLLDKGANPNVESIEQYGIPLLMAARNLNLEAVKLLIERGAILEAVDKYGNNILDSIFKSKNKDLDTAKKIAKIVLSKNEYLFKTSKNIDSQGFLSFCEDAKKEEMKNGDLIGLEKLKKEE